MNNYKIIEKPNLNESTDAFVDYFEIFDECSKVYPIISVDRQLKRSVVRYLHGESGTDFISNGDFTSGLESWQTLLNNTQDNFIVVNNPVPNNGNRYLRIESNNTLDETADPSQLSHIRQIGGFVSSAGSGTQIFINIVSRQNAPTELDPLVPPLQAPQYFYLKIGDKYFDLENNLWSNNLVWNYIDYGGIVGGTWVSHEYTTPVLEDSGLIEIVLTGIPNVDVFPVSVDYDLIAFNIITDGEISVNTSTDYIAESANFGGEVYHGAVYNFDGITAGNKSRLSLDQQGNTNTLNWNGLSLQEAISGGWIALARVNRRRLFINFKTTRFVINRGLIFKDSLYVPVSYTWNVRYNSWDMVYTELRGNIDDISYKSVIGNSRRPKTGNTIGGLS